MTVHAVREARHDIAVPIDQILLEVPLHFTGERTFFSQVLIERVLVRSLDADFA